MRVGDDRARWHRRRFRDLDKPLSTSRDCRFVGWLLVLSSGSGGAAKSLRAALQNNLWWNNKNKALDDVAFLVAALHADAARNFRDLYNFGNWWAIRSVRF
jgi:hypothetical protein